MKLIQPYTAVATSLGGSDWSACGPIMCNSRVGEGM